MGTRAPAFAPAHSPLRVTTHAPWSGQSREITYTPGAAAGTNLTAADCRAPFTTPSAVASIFALAGSAHPSVRTANNASLATLLTRAVSFPPCVDGRLA